MIKLTELLELYGEEYNLNLEEGLIKTIEIGKAISILKKQFQDINVYIYKINKEINSFKINIDRPSFKIIKKILTISNNLGWYPSFFRYKTKEDKIAADKWNDDILKVLEQLDEITIDFEAKFDIEIDKIPKALYHITPLINWEKIKKNGLAPKSRSKATFHPDRIFLANNEQDAEELGSKFYQKTGVKDWVVLKINTALVPGDYLKLYQDVNYKDKGFYTLNNIPPIAIEKIKDINI
jgi:hypothetical protein